MTNIGSIIAKFKTLSEFNEFLAQLTEGQSGEEIARGMNPHDKSKIAKEAESSEGEAPGGAAPAEGGEAPGPVFDPVAAPGSQIAIGKKVSSGIHNKPAANKIEVTGDASPKVNTKPVLYIDKR